MRILGRGNCCDASAAMASAAVVTAMAVVVALGWCTRFAIALDGVEVVGISRLARFSPNVTQISTT